MPGKILIVDDEPAIRAMIRLALSRQDYVCAEAADVPEAERRIREDMPDLVLLDWMLPGVSGTDYARKLRREKLTRHLPVILLTARGTEDDKVRGFDAGADDYITKPFAARELIARVRSLIRRAAPERDDAVLTVGGLSLDPATHRVAAGGQSLAVGPTEFRLLQFFMSHPERVHSRERLLDQVWGHSVYIDERTVDVHIRRLRKALAPTGHDTLVQTVRGAGYRLSEEH